MIETISIEEKEDLKIKINESSSIFFYLLLPPPKMFETNRIEDWEEEDSKLNLEEEE